MTNTSSYYAQDSMLPYKIHSDLSILYTNVNSYTVKNPELSNTIQIKTSDQKEVVRIDRDGRIFWLGREVTTDDEFRQTMLELHKAFTTR